MRTPALLVLGAMLMGFFFQCCPSAAPEEVAVHAPAPEVGEIDYTDPRGWFSVSAPLGWRITEFDDPRSKVSFTKGNNSVHIIVEEYSKADVILEEEKERIRGGFPDERWENPVVIDGVEGWSIGYDTPIRGVVLRGAVFVKNGRWHTITLAGDVPLEQIEQIWDGILRSFKSLGSH